MIALRPCLAASLLLLAACGSDEESPPACHHRVCALDKPSCVERAAEVVGCQLRRPFLSPALRFLTAEEVVAEWEAEVEPPTPEEEQAAADELRGLALLGLMPEGYVADDTTADQIRNVVAYYSSDAKEIVVIADHVPTDPAAAYGVLVHEIVHAYQDQQWGFDALLDAHAPTYDRFFGLRALTEGEAVLYQNLADLERLGIPETAVDWASYFSSWQANVLDLAVGTETAYIDTLTLFPYAFGGQLALNAWQSSERAALRDVYAKPPDSVRQAKQGYFALPDRFANEDATFDPEAAPRMPAGYGLVHGGHEGVWALNAMLQRTAEGGIWEPALDDVSADYLSIYRDNAGGVAAIWRVRSSHPDLFEVAVSQGDSLWRTDDATQVIDKVVATAGSDVLLIAVSQGDARDVRDAIEGFESPDESSPNAESSASVTGQASGGERGPEKRRRRLDHLPSPNR